MLIPQIFDLLELNDALYWSDLSCEIQIDIRFCSHANGPIGKANRKVF